MIRFYVLHTAKIVKVIENAKFYLSFPLTRYESVGCDGGEVYLSQRSATKSLTAYLKTAKQVKNSDYKINRKSFVRNLALTVFMICKKSEEYINSIYSIRQSNRGYF